MSSTGAPRFWRCGRSVSSCSARWQRREADESSDVDVLLVRPQGADDETWSASVEERRQCTRRLTGNRVEVLEADASDIARLLRGHKPLWKDIRSRRCCRLRRGPRAIESVAQCLGVARCGRAQSPRRRSVPTCRKLRSTSRGRGASLPRAAHRRDQPHRSRGHKMRPT
jgi:hypothetical protein